MKQSETTSSSAAVAVEGRKRGKWGYIWPLWTTLLLHLLAILLFTAGFLLTRTELPYHSHCSDVSSSPCFSSNNGSCWTKPAVNRLVLVVLDALRYTTMSGRCSQLSPFINHVLFCDSRFRFDFVVPSTFFAGYLSHLFFTC